MPKKEIDEPPSCDVDVIVNDDLWHEKISELDLLIKNVINDVLSFLSAELYTSNKYNIAIVLTNDDEIQHLNKQFRQQDKATNVLSFPSGDEPQKEKSNHSLGDVILSITTLEREAIEQSKSLQNHVSHMLVHGVLHLLGFDHMKAEEATEMESLEIEILANMRINNPYE